MRNAECGKKKRGQKTEFGMRNAEVEKWRVANKNTNEKIGDSGLKKYGFRTLRKTDGIKPVLCFVTLEISDRPIKMLLIPSFRLPHSNFRIPDTLHPRLSTLNPAPFTVSFSPDAYYLLPPTSNLKPPTPLSYALRPDP
jgi:hypothetical protein